MIRDVQKCRVCPGLMKCSALERHWLVNMLLFLHFLIILHRVLSFTFFLNSLGVLYQRKDKRAGKAEEKLTLFRVTVCCSHIVMSSMSAV